MLHQNLMLVFDKQFTEIDQAMEVKLAEKLWDKFHPENCPFLPNEKKEGIAFILKKIKETKNWKLETDQLVIEYVRLALREEKMNSPQYQPELKKLMTWPNRDGHTKLEYLKLNLSNKHVIN